MNKKNLFQLILAAGDIILMYLALFLVLAFRYNDFSPLPGPLTRQFFLHFSVIQLVWLALFFSFDFYEIPAFKKPLVFLKNLAGVAIMAFGVGALYFYLNLHSLIAPKTILFFDVLFFSVFAFSWRWFFSKLIGAQRFAKKIAVVGWQPEMDELVNSYLKLANYEIACAFSPGAFAGFEKLKIFPNHKDFIRAINEGKIDLMVLAEPLGVQNSILQNIISNVALNIKIISLKDFYQEIAQKLPLDLIDEMWLLENISKNPRNSRLAKRFFDIILSLLGITITLIIFPLICLAIKLDSRGPVFYIQERRGRDGKNFLLYKFRTMKSTSDQYDIWRAGDGDQVTKTGKFFKKLHIDEFPQFFNILKGDLSFVGPRPEWTKLAGDYEKEIPFYRYRYLVQPGFTGWAQINYHASYSAFEAKEKFGYDLYYIKNQSFLLDIAIILKTIQLFFR